MKNKIFASKFYAWIWAFELLSKKNQIQLRVAKIYSIKKKLRWPVLPLAFGWSEAQALLFKNIKVTIFMIYFIILL